MRDLLKLALMFGPAAWAVGAYAVYAAIRRSQRFAADYLAIVGGVQAMAGE